MKQLLSKKVGLVFILVQFIITIAFIGLVMFVDVLADRYLLMVAIVLAILMAYTFFSQMTKKIYIVGRVLSGVFCVFMIVVAAYLWKGYSTINNMADANVKVDELTAIVMADDTAEKIGDVIDSDFGIIEVIGREYTDKMINLIQTNLKCTVNTKLYGDVNSLVQALYDGEVRVIIFNEAYRETVLESFKDFDTATKVLDTYEIETVVEEEEEEEEEKKEDKYKPFIVYCSGIDAFGTIAKTSRSDVNILAVVNPKTAQILLVNTPRDYYVPLSISNGVCDKLTHAGIYGVDVSMETLEMLYDIDIDYYARVNFTGITDLVDALGGVKLYSEKTFTSDWGPSFKEGYNNVNGEQALAFCRERHHFGDGDRQRGKNHQYMIAAIFDKATSPAILTKFTDVMNSIEDSFETNMKTKTITKWVKYQTDKNPKWKINSISVDGTGGKSYTYSMPSKRSYVMYPDEQTINEAKDAIQTILSGGKLKKKKDEESSESKNSSN